MKILLEGLTGTGKSQTLAAMRRLGLLPELVVREEETLGEVMDEIDGEIVDPSKLTRRLASVCARLEREPANARSFLLERFHLSYYALAPTWAFYDDLDARLFALGASIVLLVVPEADLRTRSLLREEHGGTDWQGFCAHFGSERSALDALRASQDRRIEALARSRLPHTVIDTSAKAWDAYARAIAVGA